MTSATETALISLGTSRSEATDLLRMVGTSASVGDVCPGATTPHDQRDRNETPAKCDERKPGSRQNESKTKWFSVYVGQLPLSMNEVMLHQLFEKCGKIVDIHLAKANENVTKRYGFVRFSTLDSAKHAIKVMNNYQLSGHKLKVEIASDTRQAMLDSASGSEQTPKHRPLRLRPYSQEQKNLVAKLKESFSKLQAEHEKLMEDLKKQDPPDKLQGNCTKVACDMSDIARRLAEMRCGLSPGVGSEGKVSDIPERVLPSHDDKPHRSLVSRMPVKRKPQIHRMNSSHTSAAQMAMKSPQSNQVEIDFKGLSTQEKVVIGRGVKITNNFVTKEAKKIHQVNPGKIAKSMQDGKRQDTQAVQEMEKPIGSEVRLPAFGRGAMAYINY